MSNIKKYWDDLSDWKKVSILKENLFWEGLFEFKFESIPEDLKKILKENIKRKLP